jgi:hypothetical protein
MPALPEDMTIETRRERREFKAVMGPSVTSDDGCQATIEVRIIGSVKTTRLSLWYRFKRWCKRRRWVHAQPSP